MRVPVWARWALAAVLVVAVATAGVAANLAVLGGESDDTRLGTLSARSIDPAATPIPIPEQAGEPDGDTQGTGNDRGGENGDDHREDDGDDDDDD